MKKLEKPQPITLTAQEFIDAWNGGYKGVQEEDGKGYWDFFGEKMIIDNIEVIEEIRVTDLKDLPSLMIRNSSIGTIEIHNSSTGGLSVKKSKIGKIGIYNNSRTGNFEIEKSNFGNFIIWESTIGFFTLHDCSELDFFYVTDSTTDDFSIDSSSTKYFSIHKSSIGEFRIVNSSVAEIKVDENSVVGGLSINYNSTIKGALYISNSNVFEVELHSKELRKVTLNKNYIQKLEWNQDSFCLFTLDSCRIEYLKFSQSIIPKDSVFQLRDTAVNRLSLNQLVNTAWLNIVGLKPLENYQKFVTDSYGHLERNNGKYLFKQISNHKTTLGFIYSDLGKTSFVNCDLNAFTEFIFYNTKMLEVFVAGTQLPTKITFLLKGEKSKKYSQKRLAFSQFKKISNNKGDNVQATEFLSLEMDAYAKQIFFNLFKEPSKLGELINIGLNKVSSNHGNNWFQAVVVTLLINVLCFWCYCYSLGYTYNKVGDWNLFYKLASYSFEFLNPLRKTDFLQIEIPPLARVIDYSSRIIVAYFTYQTIQAFRRFGNK